MFREIILNISVLPVVSKVELHVFVKITNLEMFIYNIYGYLFMKNCRQPKESGSGGGRPPQGRMHHLVLQMCASENI